MHWDSSENYQKIALANKLYYEKNANHYDQTETCITDKRFQDELYDDLKLIKVILDGGCRRSRIKVLDACGGSGNAALKILELGMEVWLCDQSQNLINIFEKKCREKGYECHFILSEIGQYLETTHDAYDLIIFSSALHHLHDYEGILRLALKRLNNNGMIFTCFDPVKWEFPAKQIVKIEYIVFKLLNDFSDFFPAAYRRIRKIFSYQQEKENRSVKEDNLGELAEFHIDKGMDDDILVDQLKLHGAEIIWHKKLCKSRYKFFELLLSLFGCKTNFKLLIRKSV